MRRKMMKLIAVLMAVFMMMPVLPVQAASSYVMGDSSGSIVTSGSYQVKLTGNKLYSRKGSGNWKAIASSRETITSFTTNGSTVYYAITNYNYVSSNGCSQIYSVSVNGGSTRRITTINKKSVSSIYRYNDKLYMTERHGKNGGDLYSYSLSTKRHQKIAPDKFMMGAWQEYGIMTFGRYYKWATPLYSKNLLTGRTKELTKYSYGHITSGNYVYYISYFKGISAYRENGTFVIKRATINGNNVKTLTKNLVGKSPRISGNYVIYDYNGRTKSVRFK